MSEQKITLSLDETNIYSGVCLTYSGMPFHRVEKTRTSSADEDRLDRLFNRFVRAKGELRRRAADGSSEGGSATSTFETIELGISDSDLEFLIEIFEAVLQEHQPPGERSDDNLELHVGPREAVEEALESLRSVCQEQTNH